LKIWFQNLLLNFNLYRYVSANDRPGLLHDISQGLNRLQVQLLHCEASAVANRSVSIWRLQAIRSETTRVRLALSALLNNVRDFPLLCPCC
jgi:glycine cleavage system regulatory protein